MLSCRTSQRGILLIGTHESLVNTTSGRHRTPVTPTGTARLASPVSACSTPGLLCFDYDDPNVPQEVVVAQHVGGVVATARGDVIPESHEVADLHPLIHQHHPLATPTGHQNLHDIFSIKSTLRRDEPGMKIPREPSLLGDRPMRCALFPRAATLPAGAVRRQTLVR